MLKRWCTRTVVAFAGLLLTACIALLCLVIVAAGSLVGVSLALVRSTGAAAQVAKVNLNTASQGELEALRGIGPATARRIIRNRPYATTAELSRAEVAGPIIELISHRVTVEAARVQSTSR